jgi:hypothetical protein
MMSTSFQRAHVSRKTVQNSRSRGIKGGQLLAKSEDFESRIGAVEEEDARGGK